MKRAISLMLALGLSLSLCACGEKVTSETIEAYNNANACFAQNRYEDAAKLYLQAGDYEDTQQKLLEIYYHAVNLYEKGSHDEAAPLFSVLAEADINNSAEYANTILFQEAMNSASYAFEKALDIEAAYEWLNTAQQYATEEQKQEIADYEAFIEKTAYYEGTQFMTLQYYRGINNVSQSKATGTGYTLYRYSGSSKRGYSNSWPEAWEDAEKYVSNYLEVNFRSELMVSSISGDLRFETVCFDDSGNAIFTNMTLSGDSIWIDVYVIQSGYVNRYLEERK